MLSTIPFNIFGCKVSTNRAKKQKKIPFPTFIVEREYLVVSIFGHSLSRNGHLLWLSSLKINTLQSWHAFCCNRKANFNQNGNDEEKMDLDRDVPLSDGGTC